MIYIMTKMKLKTTTIFMSVIILIGAGFVHAADIYNVPAIEINGFSYISLKETAEQLECNVSWDDESTCAKIEKNGIERLYKIGAEDGEPRLIDDKTYVTANDVTLLQGLYSEQKQTSIHLKR